MSDSKWEVEFYETPKGRCPTQTFLDKLKRRNKKVHLLVTNAIKRLEKHGLDLDRPHVGTLRDHINELRVITNHGNYRLFYFFCYENRFVITHGTSKKSDEVADSDIQKAIEYRLEYLSR